MRRILLLVLGLALGFGIVTACGDSQPVTYAPAAYGQNNTCYWINSPAEAVALQNAGLCPRSWGIGQAPLAWQEEYYDFYDSPGYYNVYVPRQYRSVYVTRERTFGTRYHSTIVTRSRTAVYRSSTGHTFTGTQVIKAKAKYGSGTSFGTSGTKYGGGSARSKSGSFGSSSRSSSHSFGGGSARSSGGHSR